MERFIYTIQDFLTLPRWLTNSKTRFFLSIIIILLALTYVIQVSAAAVSGYEIQKWEKKVQSLAEEEKKLDVELADKGSIYYLEKRLQNLSMIPAEEVIYMKEKDRSVAKR